MSEAGARDIVRAGLWSNNTGLVALLGLCPLLAVSNSAINALGLGVATVLVLTLTNLAISLLRRFASDEIRIPAYIVVIAATVTCVELAMNAWLHEMYRVLGLFIPLIVTNCAVMGRAEAFASRNSPARAALDGFAVGTGFLAVLFAIGCVREAVGHGTLFAGASRLLGPWAAPLETTLVEGYRGFLPAVLPLGAFVVLALLIAGKNALDARAKARARLATQGAAA
jgi:electron transport complex protein RnfE